MDFEIRFEIARYFEYGFRNAMPCDVLSVGDVSVDFSSKNRS
jgi:hypothetical protein